MAYERWLYGDPADVLDRKREMERRRAEKSPEGRAQRALEGLAELFGEGEMRERDFRLMISTELHERLETWGWVMRPHYKPGISPTGLVCHRLAVQAGAYKYDNTNSPPTDRQKAESWEIERAWRNPQMPMKQKMLLAGYYVYRLHPNKLSRAAAIRYSEFDEQMAKACHMIENIGKRLAARTKMSDNTSTISQPTC